MRFDIEHLYEFTIEKSCNLLVKGDKAIETRVVLKEWTASFSLPFRYGMREALNS